MRKKKFLTYLLVFGLLCNISSATINAKEMQSKGTNEDNGIEYVKMNEVDFDKNKDNDANTIERPYAGEQYTVNKGISKLRNNKEMRTDNTDPNYAYIVENGTIAQGSIEKEKEARWYAFIVNEKSKFSIVTQMTAALDADLYLFSLNSATSELNLIGGSATAGAGITEHATGVLEPGVYFFAIQGYEGTGDFAFAFYQNTNTENEPNDTYNTATPTTLGSTLTGEIDNPYDVDYYKITLTNAVLMNYSFETDANYKMELTSSGGEGFTIPGMENTYKLFPGTYYLKVSSKDLSYSPTQKYTIKTSKLSDMSSDSNANILGVCAKANIFYETDTKRTHYVNGHEIDTSYSYEKDLSNSAGSQIYNMHIYESRITSVAMGGDYKPQILRYISSTKPIMAVGSKNVLSLTFVGDALYTIHNYGSGPYNMNTFNQDLDVVNVLIDPDTGKLIDILEYNYYYHFLTVGGNRIIVTNPGYAFNFYQ